MSKILSFLAPLVVGLRLHAQAQLTNQTLITPSLRFEILNSRPESTNRFSSDEQINFMVSSTDDNGHVFALLSSGHSFIFDVRDAKGNSIKKTELGIQASQPIDVEKIISWIKFEHPLLSDKQRTDLLPEKLQIKLHPINPDRPFFNKLLVPNDYFFITKKGTYTLNVQIRAWVQTTNNQYGVVVSPPVRVEIDKN